MNERVYRSGQGLARGIRRRCPLCGEAGVFRTWLETRDACPGCGLRMDRGEADFFLGGFTLNFIVAELILSFFIALAVVLTWPAVPWTVLLWVGAPLMVLSPIAFYPFSRTIWLALDLGMRPPTDDDFQPAARGSARVS